MLDILSAYFISILCKTHECFFKKIYIYIILLPWKRELLKETIFWAQFHNIAILTYFLLLQHNSIYLNFHRPVPFSKTEFIYPSARNNSQVQSNANVVILFLLDKGSRTTHQRIYEQQQMDRVQIIIWSAATNSFNESSKVAGSLPLCPLSKHYCA